MATTIDKYSKFIFSLGEIALAKPSEWSVGTLKAVSGRFNSPEDDFIKYVVYYSQSSDDRIKKYPFNLIKELDSEVSSNLFLNFINSDESLLQKANAGHLAKNVNEACKILKTHIENIINKLGLYMLAMMLHISIADSWISALNGDLKDRPERLSNLSSIFRTAAETYPIHSQNIKDFNYLTEFDGYKTDFLFLCNRVSTLVEKVRSFDMWLPSRYSTIAIEELIAIEPAELSREKIEYVIFKSVDSDVEEKILPDWKGSILFEGREKIIKEAFEAHKSKLFAPSITCFLTQLDHVVLELARSLKVDKKRRNANYKMLQDVCTYMEETIMWNIPVTTFLKGDIGEQLYLFQRKSLVKYLRDVVFQDTERIKSDKDAFNRHGILHGVFANYPSAKNSTKLILLIDDLNNFFHGLPKYLSRE